MKMIEALDKLQKKKKSKGWAELGTEFNLTSYTTKSKPAQPQTQCKPMHILTRMALKVERVGAVVL